MKSTTIAIIAIIVVILAGIFIVKYNTMASLDEKVVTKWNPLEGMLESRYDSVPRLVGAITLYVGHDISEDDALSRVYPEFAAAKTIDARTAAANQIENALQQLKQSVSERYQGIISNAQVESIISVLKRSQEEMKEKLVAYNAAATDYNTYIRRFPNNLVALILGFSEKYEYIQPQM